MSLSRASRVALAIMVLVAALAYGCGGGGDDTSTGPAQPDTQGTNVAKIYQVLPGITVYGVDHTYRTQDFTDDAKEWDPVFDLISQAQTSLDIAVMRINRQAFVDALLDRSVTAHIRVVTEKAYYEDPLYRPFYQQLLNPLRNNGNIEIVTDNEGTPRLMHSRFMIIDHAKVAVGSYNYSVEGSERTMGDVVVINDVRVAGAFEDQFEQMFVEGKFGAHKRDSIQHAYSVGGGAAQIELYFGPTDEPRDLAIAEIEASQYVIGAVQQFSDLTLASYIYQWLSGDAGIGAPENRALYLTINDIGSYGDEYENAVYDALVAGIAGGGGGDDEEVYAAGFIVNQPPDSIWASVGAHLNHKYIYADHAATGGLPSMMISTGNWTTQGFDLNDEAIVILRGTTLTSKYHYAYWFQSAHMGSDFITRDVREDAQISMMYPFVTNLEAEDLRVPRDPALADLSCGLIHGQVTNFQREFTYQDSDGNLQTMQIDLQWEITGEYYFGGNITGYVNPLFDENELTNPDDNYILVVPAGRIQVLAVVTDPDGTPVDLFTPDAKIIDIGPGGVRRENFSVSGVQIGDDTTGGPGAP